MTIEFNWKGKMYTAEASPVQVTGVVTWMVEMVSGKTFLLTRDAKGWDCRELSKEQCRIIGEAIEKATLA